MSDTMDNAIDLLQRQEQNLRSNPILNEQKNTTPISGGSSANAKR